MFKSNYVDILQCPSIYRGEGSRENTSLCPTSAIGRTFFYPSQISKGGKLGTCPPLDWCVGTWWQPVSIHPLQSFHVGYLSCSSEKILDKFAVFQEKLYFYTSKIPRWMYLLLSGGVGSIALQLLHRKPNKPAAPTISPSTEAQTQQTIKAASSAVEPKRAAAKRRDIKK